MDYKSKFHNEDIDHLLDIILDIKDKELLYRFFEDLLTIKEIQDMASRLKIAKLLYDKVPYNQITEITGASAATISRINKSLVYGANGYLRILEKKE